LLTALRCRGLLLITISDNKISDNKISDNKINLSNINKTTATP
jgi:hypothetical protein